MNEIQIKLGGKDRTLRFDVGTMKLIAKKTKEDALDPMTGLDGYTQALYACYFGMFRYCKIQKRSPDFELADVEEWIDDLSMQEMVDIMKAYSDAYTLKSDGAASVEDGADKKK